MRGAHWANNHLSFVAFASIILALPVAPVAAQNVEQFYKGKTVDIIIGYTPGGGYDTYGRTVARHIGKYIPGNPNVVPRNMPGGGSRTAAAHMYAAAAKDGLSIGLVDQSLVLQQAVDDPTIRFDLRRFSYIGNAASDSNMVAVSASTGVKTVEDARQREVIIGSTGPNTTSIIPITMNQLLGTKFKIVFGYPGANEMNVAQERGEIEGQASKPWGSWKATLPSWIAEKKVIFIAQVALKKASDLPDVPLLIDFARTDEDRDVLKLLSAPSTVGRPFFTTPDTPKDRVDALRKAFDATMNDATLLSEAKRLNLDIEPSTGAELEKVINEILSTPKPVSQRLAEIINSIPK
jgi:tripartite-type tricarboxylate transporter receptor subunit TctC